MEVKLSSAKRGYGVKELFSSVDSEYWSSDDSLPHYIQLTFPINTYVYSINMLLSYSVDESYTPEKIVIYYNNKQKNYTVTEPDGFKEFVIDEFLFDIYIIIHANHSDGKDSHIRMLKVMKSPDEEILYNY